jgi:hypothetical protein
MNRRHRPGPHCGPYHSYGRIGCCMLLWLALATEATADPSDICITAARDAAASSDVPMSVLIAITQTETGRGQDGQTRPWPWTVNMEGEGHWFDSRDAALTYVFEQYNRGARSFDIGCFQINFRWHGEQFASIEEMFDPGANAAYAAQFLSQLHAESGNWSTAAGAFHSRTEAQAAGYRTTFDRFQQAAIAAGADSGGYDTGAPVLLAAAETGDGPATLPHTNSFPLLQASTGNRALGSLVPLSP